jgi:hypothetical protein
MHAPTQTKQQWAEYLETPPPVDCTESHIAWLTPLFSDPNEPFIKPLTQDGETALMIILRGKVKSDAVLWFIQEIKKKALTLMLQIKVAGRL